jgi:hypothetical protein
MSQTQQPEIFNAVLTGWAMYVADFNTTITVETTSAANSLVGYLPAETFEVDIDNQQIRLTKHKTGSENAIEIVSGGQTFVAMFPLHELAKGTIQKILGGNVTIPSPPLVATTPDVGTLEGKPNNGEAIKSYRVVFIPEYLSKAGTKITGSASNQFMIEIPRANIRSNFNPQFEVDGFAQYDVEVEALANLNNQAHWKIGNIDLTITP